MQRIFQVGAIKKILQDRSDQNITAKMLQKHFDSNLEISSGEACTEHFITVALALWNALFSVSRLKATSLQLALQQVAMIMTLILIGMLFSIHWHMFFNVFSS